MSLPFFTLSVFAIIVSIFGFSAGAKCPPKQELKPCTCTDTHEVTAVCKNIIDRTAMSNAFTKNRKWSIEKVHIDQCTIDYIPSSILTYGSLKQVNVSSSTLVTLFDENSVQTNAIDLFLYDVKLLRGFEWKILKNSSISGLGTFNFEVRNFGKDFKEYMPAAVRNLWFENSKTSRIAQEAFSKMVNLDVLTITGGSIKKISRDMFPRPWNIKFWNLSGQKLTELPEDMFADCPQLFIFTMMRNHLTTIDEKIFTKSPASYYLNNNPIYCDCSTKWITTTGRQTLRRFIGKCTGPESFAGKELKKLTEEDFDFCQ